MCVLILGLSLVPSSYAATTHTLARGDTYYSLSRKYGVSVNELKKANPKINPASLKIGQVLNIPADAPEPKSPSPVPSATPIPGGIPPKNATTKGTPLPSPSPTPTPIPEPASPEFHTVGKGDTLTRISILYKTPVAELKSLNNLKSSDLSIGQKIRLRSSAAPVAKDPVTPPPLAQKDPEPEPRAVPSPVPNQRYLFVTPVKKLIDNVPKTTRKWKFVVVHHSGTATGNAKIFEYYHRHVRGMENGMAYHFVIGNGSDSGDGEIEVGNRWKLQLQGGHLRSDEQNEIAIGICLVGDFNKNRPTKKQIASVIELITYLRQRQNPQELKFVVHRDINIRPTDCPGNLFPAQAMYNLFGKGNKNL